MVGSSHPRGNGDASPTGSRDNDRTSGDRDLNPGASDELKDSIMGDNGFWGGAKNFLRNNPAMVGGVVHPALGLGIRTLEALGLEGGEGYDTPEHAGGGPNGNGSPDPNATPIPLLQGVESDNFRQFLDRLGVGSDGSDSGSSNSLTDASRGSLDAAQGFGNRIRDFAEKQYSDLRPFIEDIVTTQRDAGGESLGQARDFYDRIQNTFRPVEDEIVNNAQNFNTDAYRNELANKAAADSAKAFQRTQQANARNLQSMGVNPNSGRYAATQQAAATRNAADRAGLMNDTRRQARDTGYQRMFDAANLGSGLRSASQTAYGTASKLGSAATNNATVPGQQVLSAFGQGVDTTMAGRELYQQGLNSVMGNNTRRYGINQDVGLGQDRIEANEPSTFENLGNLIGTGASIYNSGLGGDIADSIGGLF